MAWDQEDDYERVSGTATGGATFLGLVRLLGLAKTFEEALALADRGDSSNVDKVSGQWSVVSG